MRVWARWGCLATAPLWSQSCSPSMTLGRRAWPPLGTVASSSPWVVVAVHFARQRRRPRCPAHAATAATSSEQPATPDRLPPAPSPLARWPRWQHPAPAAEGAGARQMCPPRLAAGWPRPQHLPPVADGAGRQKRQAMETRQAAAMAMAARRAPPRHLLRLREDGRGR